MCGGNWLRTGADAADSVGSILAVRNIQRKIDDGRDALAAMQTAAVQLETLTAKYPDLIPVLRQMFQAERDATEAHLGALDDEITALDINAGAGIARTLQNLSGGGGIGGAGLLGGSGAGTALAVGAAGLGVGLLLQNNNNNRRR